MQCDSFSRYMVSHMVMSHMVGREECMVGHMVQRCLTYRRLKRSIHITYRFVLSPGTHLTQPIPCPTLTTRFSLTRLCVFRNGVRHVATQHHSCESGT